jgi:hypothetical protein
MLERCKSSPLCNCPRDLHNSNYSHYFKLKDYLFSISFHIYSISLIPLVNPTLLSTSIECRIIHQTYHRLVVARVYKMLHASRTGFQGFCVSSLRFLVLNLSKLGLIYGVLSAYLYLSGHVGDLLSSIFRHRSCDLSINFCDFPLETLAVSSILPCVTTRYASTLHCPLFLLLHLFVSCSRYTCSKSRPRQRDMAANRYAAAMLRLMYFYLGTPVQR